MAKEVSDKTKTKIKDAIRAGKMSSSQIRSKYGITKGQLAAYKAVVTRENKEFEFIPADQTPTEPQARTIPSLDDLIDSETTTVVVSRKGRSVAFAMSGDFSVKERGTLLGAADAVLS